MPERVPRSKAMIEEDLRDALNQFNKLQDIKGRPPRSTLSMAIYERMRRADSLGATRVRDIYGHWPQACSAAGLKGTRLEGGKQYDTDDLLFWVDDYLSSLEASGSLLDFSQWLSDQPDAPCSRTIFDRLGSWADIKQSFGWTPTRKE